MGLLSVGRQEPTARSRPTSLGWLVGKQAAVLQGLDVQLVKASFDDSLALKAST